MSCIVHSTEQVLYKRSSSLSSISLGHFITTYQGHRIPTAKRRSLSSLLVHISPLQLDLIRAVSLDCATVNGCLHSHFRCVVETAIWTLTRKPTTYPSFFSWPFFLP